MIRLIGFLFILFVIVLAVRALRRSAPLRPAMSRAEALEALGVPEGASDEQVMKAYKLLMTRVHPDTPGGLTYLATKLNQAKDVLLG